MEPSGMTFYSWIPKLLKFKPTLAKWVFPGALTQDPLYTCFEKTVGGYVIECLVDFPKFVEADHYYLLQSQWISMASQVQ